MKKCLSVLLCILCLSSLLILPVHAAPICFPDVDGDGKLSSTDARAILRSAVALDNFTPAQLAVADCNADGIITADDARSALRMAVGLDIDMLAQSRIFRSGHFACKGTIVKDNTTTDVYFATADSTFLISTDLDFGDMLGIGQTNMVNVSYLVTPDIAYMCSNTHQIYTSLTEENLNNMGYNTAEEMFKVIDVSDFAFKLSADDEPISAEMITKNGKPVTCYTFKTTGNGLQKHYVSTDGSLILVEDFNYRGTLQASLSLYSITNNLQRAMLALPDDYTEERILNFFLSLLSDQSFEIQ